MLGAADIGLSPQDRWRHPCLRPRPGSQLGQVGTEKSNATVARVKSALVYPCMISLVCLVFMVLAIMTPLIKVAQSLT